MQGTRVRSLVWEDPTGLRAIKPERCNFWAHTVAAPHQEKPLQWEACALQLESSLCSLQLACVQQQRRSAKKPKKQKPCLRASLMATRVGSLVQDDPTCLRATKPMLHNYWACALGAQEPQLLSTGAATAEAHTPRACVPQQEKLLWCEACALQLESSSCSLQLKKSLCSNEDPASQK